ncbi:MAG TPA: phosphatase PAP2 family protein, partial [Chloroflexota bacterium]|nr:phosphatase PAP2 family protein [Chloroflexota bacterium]
GYCARQRPRGLALAAGSIAVALTINMVATWEIQRSPPRERPFLHVAEARTVVQSCAGPLHAGSRGAGDAIVECGAAGTSPGARQGLDWQNIWVHYPSFPSGHMRETAALSVLLAAFWPASRLFAVALLIAMGYTRVLFGAHYPTDVFGGALLGLWSGAVTLTSLVAARHAVARLAAYRPVRVSWEYVARVRRAGRPDLDPLPARLIRATSALVAANVVVVVVGIAGGNAWAENVLELLGDTQKWVSANLPFRPVSVAPTLSLGAAAVVALLAACRHHDRWAAPARGTLAVLCAALVLATQLLWVGSMLFARPEQDAAGGPLAAFPAPQSLFAAALVSAMALRSWQLSVPGQVLAALTAALSALAGGATVHAALSGYVAGAACGTLARHVTAQLMPLPVADDDAASAGSDEGDLPVAAAASTPVRTPAVRGAAA